MLGERDQRLLRNQVVLHTRSRGPLVERDGALCFESPSPEMRYWLLSRRVELPKELQDVRLLPGADVDERALLAQGFAADGALRYLWILPQLAQAADPGVEIVRGSGSAWPEPREALVRTISEILHEGFGTGDLEKSYARNLVSSIRVDESMYLARVGGAPASVAHTLFTEGLLGIYGVVTRPEHRKRGLARALLLAAFDEARERGAELVTLQTWAGSAPERLYRKLGFIPAFDVKLYVRGRPLRAER